MEKESANEQPLNPPAKAALMCGAGATILLFYLFALVSILFLVLLTAVEFALTIAAARVGLAGVMAQVLRRHLSLLGLFLRSFRVRKQVEFRISLRPEDAPGLFALVQKLSDRLAMAAPNVVSLEMSVNASVRLKGLRSGAGTTKLSIGYDLLAGLSQAEAEAVLAHEMVHAKLIQRGLKQWLSFGLNRVATLTRALAAQVEAYRRVKRSFELAEFFLRCADWLTRLAARLVAKYSRQDEFEADHGAAELCGAAPIRSSLLKIDALARLAARLPWRERVAQLQLQGFSQWLVKELALGESFQAPENSRTLFDKYSTHPLLRDRLAALPPASGPSAGNPRPAIELLAEPDKIAEKLIVEIQRVAAEEEQKDSREQLRKTRKFRGSALVRPVQLLGIIIIIAGALTAIIGMLMDQSWGTMVLGIFIFAGGLGVHRLGRYRDRVALPVPDFAAIKLAGQEGNKVADIAGAQKQIEAELRPRAAGIKRRKDKTTLLVAESYAALGRCDYLRAHVAARLCRDVDKKSVEGTLALAIASAALHQGQQAAWTLKAVQRLTGLGSPSAKWGAAWALVLLGDWATAEGFLDQLLKDRESEPTFLALRAVCQSKRGKLQSAILSARQACQPQPRNPQYSKLLIDLLLDGGHLREAEERILPLETEARTDRDLAFAVVRVKLMRRDLAAAREWTDLLMEMSAQPAGTRMLVRLGEAYEAARNGESAATFYQQALAAAHYPEAHLGMARLEAGRQNKEQARQHLLAALNTKRPVGEGGIGPLPLFQRIVTQLLQLQEPELNCRAWVARLAANVSVPALANQSFMIYAPARAEAERYLNLIVGAMQPELPPVQSAIIHWHEAPRQQQPDGPCRPGVQGVLG